MIAKIPSNQLERYVSAVVRSFESSSLLSQVCVPRIVEAWTRFIDGGAGFCYGADIDGEPAGILLALHTDDLISGEKHALEYLWLVTRAGRQRGLSRLLFEAFEADAKTSDCYRIVVGCNSVFKRGQLARWYRMRGYSIFSEAYQKVI